VIANSGPAIANGLLIDGARVLVPGLTIVGPGDDPSCMLDPGDYAVRPRVGDVRQIIVHSTKGAWPMPIIPGAGAGGYAKNTADYWSKSEEGKRTHGGAQLVVDDNGVIWCLCDLARIAAYHATTSNMWSIGIEMYQRGDGGVHEATLVATVALVAHLCEWFSVPFQIPSRVYNNDAIDRMKFNGGPDMYGVFGHRDNAWDFERHTSSRGRGDPGDEIYVRLAVAGAERFDFQAHEDVAVWKRRQRALNARGAQLVEDGAPGPRTIAAMRAAGFRSGREIPA